MTRTDVPFLGGRALGQDAPVITGTGSRLLVGQVLRVLAVGSGVALGLFVWAISFHLPFVGRPQLEVLAVLLVLGVLAARAVPGVRWGGALTGVLAPASAFVAAESVYWVVHHLWQRGLGGSVPASGSRLLLYAAVGVVAWAVTAVLLRVSDGLLPGTATRSVRQAAVRAVAMAAGPSTPALRRGPCGLSAGYPMADTGPVHPAAPARLRR